MRNKFLITFTLLMLMGQFLKAQNKTDDIIGTWLTNGDDPAKIRIYKSEQKFYGKIVWLKNPDYNGRPKVDNNNPDKSKRNNPTIGMLLLTNFMFDGKAEWKGGTIYDPESGKTYSSFMTLKDENTLKVRGYVGLSLFGRTETWTRTN